ncbi:MAG: class I SAM-dependent methyltransferase [Candidatus Synoicihabitans palmerolidicus]|nr:class I SAM-dependent methyltransferase [Candidatus Synoicihabitans palmerolidicus]
METILSSTTLGAAKLNLGAHFIAIHYNFIVPPFTPVRQNDHFSSFAATYASFRPTYPTELFIWLASQSPAQNHAWDCATGTGQAAISLAAHFDQVTGTDVGAPMIANAAPHPRVTYRVGPAENAPLPEQSVDLNHRRPSVALVRSSRLLVELPTGPSSRRRARLLGLPRAFNHPGPSMPSSLTTTTTSSAPIGPQIEAPSLKATPTSCLLPNGSLAPLWP